MESHTQGLLLGWARAAVLVSVCALGCRAEGSGAPAGRAVQSASSSPSAAPHFELRGADLHSAALFVAECRSRNVVLFGDSPALPNLRLPPTDESLEMLARAAGLRTWQVADTLVIARDGPSSPEATVSSCPRKVGLHLWEAPASAVSNLLDAVCPHRSRGLAGSVSIYLREATAGHARALLEQFGTPSEPGPPLVDVAHACSSPPTRRVRFPESSPHELELIGTGATRDQNPRALIRRIRPTPCEASPLAVQVNDFVGKEESQPQPEGDTEKFPWLVTAIEPTRVVLERPLGAGVPPVVLELR